MDSSWGCIAKVAYLESHLEYDKILTHYRKWFGNIPHHISQIQIFQF